MSFSRRRQEISDTGISGMWYSTASPVRSTQSAATQWKGGFRFPKPPMQFKGTQPKKVVCRVSKSKPGTRKPMKRLVLKT